MSLEAEIEKILLARQQALEMMEDEEVILRQAMDSFFKNTVRLAFIDFENALEANEIRVTTAITSTSATLSAFHSGWNKPAEFIYTMRKFEDSWEVFVQMTAYGILSTMNIGSFVAVDFSTLTKSNVLTHMLEMYSLCQKV